MSAAGPDSLFGWQGRREAAVLQVERDRLARQIAKLPVRSPRRIGLEMLLTDLTRRTLVAELGRPKAANEDRP